MLGGHSGFAIETFLNQAFSNVEAKILEILEKSDRKGPKFVYIVALNPVDETGVIWGKTVGDAPPKGRWKRQYDQIAISKAQISQRGKSDSWLVVRDFPALLQASDTFFRGGVYRGGLAVGTSGLSAEDDERISSLLAEEATSLLRQFIEERRQTDDAFLRRQ